MANEQSMNYAGNIARLPTYAPSRLNPFSFSFRIRAGYQIDGSIFAEIFAGATRIYNSEEIEIDNENNFISVKLTQQQVYNLPSSAECYILWGDPAVRKLVAKLIPSIEGGPVVSNTYTIDIVEVQIVGESYNAIQAAERAEAGATAAEGFSELTEQDSIQTGADRIQTSQDKQATAADRVQTGQDKTASQAARTGAETARTGAETALSQTQAVKTQVDSKAGEAAASATNAQTAAINSGNSQVASANSASAAANSATTASQNSVRGRNVITTDAPANGEETVYPSLAGTYTNFNSVVISSSDLNAGLVQLRKVSGTWTKFIVPADTQVGDKVNTISKYVGANPRPSEWLIPFGDLKRRLLGGFNAAGEWVAYKYKALSIPGSALKNAEVTLSKLASDVTSYFAKPSDLVPYEAAKNRFPVNPIPDTYAFPIVDKNKRILGGFSKQGELFLVKFKYNPDQIIPVLAQYIRPYSGLKLVTLGNSITQSRLWQPLLVQLTGMVWSSEETFPGKDGHARMGFGGSKIVPEVIPNGSGGYESGKGPGESIYMRADDVKYYSPNVIILGGGQNDSIASNVTVDYTEAAYTGGEIVQGSGTLPSFVAAYKGTLYKLITQNPGALIICNSRMWSGTPGVAMSEASYANIKRVNDAIRECAIRYNCRYVDMFTLVGINPFNASLFMPDGTHPNADGAKKMAIAINSQL